MLQARRYRCILEACRNTLDPGGPARGALPSTVPLPPRIEGPVSAFTRLDLNEDGKITLEDLDGLARPIHLDVRFPAVIAILDTDNDGGVSPEEFYASMR